jgi:hypothetical protein
MQLFHSSCPQWDKQTGPVPRLVLHDKDDEISTRTYRCDRCGDQIHIDMDWPEGITPGRYERID